MLWQTTTPTFFDSVLAHSKHKRNKTLKLSATFSYSYDDNEWNKQNTKSTTDRISQRKLVHFRWCTVKRCAIKKKFHFHSWHKAPCPWIKRGRFCVYMLWILIFFVLFFSIFVVTTFFFYLSPYDNSQAHTHTEQTRVGNTVNTGIEIAFFFEQSSDAPTKLYSFDSDSHCEFDNTEIVQSSHKASPYFALFFNKHKHM